MNRKIYSMVFTALFGAIITIISIIPTGIYILGVPATLQTFAVAMTAYVLGGRNGTKAVLIYILLGLIGLPVFSGFRGGSGALLSITGGFIVGFIPLSIILGCAGRFKSGIKVVIVSFMGLLVCYAIGIMWFVAASKTNVITALPVIALPYLPKDILSVLVAYMVAGRLKRSLNTLEKEI